MFNNSTVFIRVCSLFETCCIFLIYTFMELPKPEIFGVDTGSVYSGVDFCKRLCGVSVIRRLDVIPNISD